MEGHYVMPMGILYVSAYVKRSGVANVHTLNLNHVEGAEYDILNSCIKDNNIDMFCIGGLSGEYSDLERIISYADKIDPDVVTVVGGGIMTADPEVTMKAMPEVDFGIIGEGEQTSVELIEAVASGGDVSAVDGLIYRDADGLKILPLDIELLTKAII